MSCHADSTRRCRMEVAKPLVAAIHRSYCCRLTHPARPCSVPTLSLPCPDTSPNPQPPPPPPPCSIICVLGGLLLQLYFGSSLPVSPYPGARERRAAARQRAAQRGGRVTPDQPPPPPPPPAVLATR